MGFDKLAPLTKVQPPEFLPSYLVILHRNSLCDHLLIVHYRNFRVCTVQELISFFLVFKGNNPMSIPAGGITTDQQPPNLISESALPTSLGATK